MKIVLNGCFDCFHNGHRYLIARALRWARRGELLILLNSDSSIQKLKGFSRPKDTFQTRQKNIELLKEHLHPHFQNMNIIKFDTEEQLESLINNFEPDLILKGNDRTDIREIIGSVNWPVCIMPRLRDKHGKDISTTEQIRMHQSEQKTDAE